jgi:hypothetical protein
MAWASLSACNKILNPHFTVTELHYSSPWKEMNAAYINFIETESSVIIPDTFYKAMTAQVILRIRNIQEDL